MIRIVECRPHLIQRIKFHVLLCWFKVRPIKLLKKGAYFRAERGGHSHWLLMKDKGATAGGTHIATINSCAMELRK